MKRWAGCRGDTWSSAPNHNARIRWHESEWWYAAGSFRISQADLARYSKWECPLFACDRNPRFLVRPYRRTPQSTRCSMSAVDLPVLSMRSCLASLLKSSNHSLRHTQSSAQSASCVPRVSRVICCGRNPNSLMPISLMRRRNLRWIYSISKRKSTMCEDKPSCKRVNRNHRGKSLFRWSLSTW